MNAEKQPMDYAPLWWIAEQEEKMRCKVCGDPECIDPDFCDEHAETLRGQQMLVGAILAAALIGTIAIIHFAARYFQ